jgi:hypothetical protein
MADYFAGQGFFEFYAGGLDPEPAGPVAVRPARSAAKR